MKKARFSEEQMVKILPEADKAPVAGWRKRFGLDRFLHLVLRLAADEAEEAVLTAEVL